MSSDSKIEWRSMQSAPRNATEVLLRFPCKGWPDHYAQVGHWASDLSGEEQPPYCGWFRNNGLGYAQFTDEPTGWAVLPATHWDAYDRGRRDLLNALLELNPEMAARLARNYDDRGPNPEGKLPFDAVFWIAGVAEQLGIKSLEELQEEAATAAPLDPANGDSSK